MCERAWLWQLRNAKKGLLSLSLKVIINEGKIKINYFIIIRLEIALNFVDIFRAEISL